MNDEIMTGVETRSSSPIRINCDEESFQCISTQGSQPSGEGAGFACGIVSAAIDGLKGDEQMIASYARPE